MHYARIADIVSGNASEETHTFIAQAVRDLYEVFSKMGWTWSGDLVTREMITDKVIYLLHYCASALDGDPGHPERQTVNIASGRIEVTAQRTTVAPNGPDAGFKVELRYSVGV